MPRPPGPGPRGILNRQPGNGNVRHARHLPAEELRPFVDCYWMVRWDLRGQPPQLAETLPHPCVYWVTELGQSAIHGVGTGRFVRLLEGRGRVFGVRFRPGGFQPFLGRAVSAITNGSLPLRTVFGKPGRAIEQALSDLDARAATALVQEGAAPAPDDLADELMMDLTDRFLLDRLPAHDPRLDTVTAIVTAIVSTPEITRVEDIAARFGYTVRSLQRLFSQFVGVSPKWVIKRYRLHEAVERMDQGQPVQWSRLALELGYFDQTHFIKDFKAMIGRSPGEYAKGVPSTAPTASGRRSKSSARGSRRSS
jgi:AraC-like DNA-binding protein